MRSVNGPSVQRGVRCICIFPTIQYTAFGLLVLLAFVCTCAQQALGQGLQADSRQSVVHGTVVNSVTHEPVGRALVYSPDNRFATLTDGEGHFEFPLAKDGADSGTDGGIGSISSGQPRRIPSGGPFWLMARKPGFLDDPNERRQVETSPDSELTIALMPEALIKGRVNISATDAATGVTVQIFSRQVQEGVPRWMPGVSVRANSNGEFRFAELLPGAYKLATHELLDNDPVVTVPGGQPYGFPPIYYPGTTDFAAAGTIQLTAGQTFQAELSLVRQPYFPVRIPVANAEPNAGVNVTVSVQGHRGPGYSLGYNPQKQWIEGQLPNGSYLVGAASFGANSASGAVNIAVAGAPAEGPVMVLTRNSSISVRIREEFTATDWNGAGSWSDAKHTFSFHGPRAYLQIRVEPAEDFGPQRSESLRPPTRENDDSLFVDNLAPGRYWVRLSSSRGYVAAATMGGIDLLHEPFVVGPGTSTPLEITMRDDNAEIDGTVAGLAAGATTSAGAAASAYPGAVTRPAYVYCVPLADSPGQFLQLSVAPDGKFNYLMMAPGVYRVMAFRNPQINLPYRDADAMRAYDSKGQVVHLSAGQKANVQLQIISSSE